MYDLDMVYMYVFRFMNPLISCFYAFRIKHNTHIHVVSILVHLCVNSRS